MNISDEAVRERTGRDRREWFAVLDGWGAPGRTHGDIVAWLIEEHGISNWWAQSMTVEYERAHGMRAVNQSRGGGFSVTSSRTIAVPAPRLFEAFAVPRLRLRWLPDFQVWIRTATPPKTWRADLDATTRVAVGFAAKGDHRAQVALLHEKLAAPEDVERYRGFWRVRLADLDRLLTGRRV